MNDNRNPHPDPLLEPIRLTADFQTFITQPPTLQHALAFLARKHPKTATPAMIREWWEQADAECWCTEQGHPIRNWPAHFNRWRLNYARFAALRAVPDLALESCGGKTPIRAHSIGKEALDALDQIL